MENEEYLAHFGVRGMKWGVRRKRNTGGRSSSSEHRVAQALGKKKLSEMTNAELKAYNTRKQLEKTYKELNPSTTKRGQKAASSVMSSIGKIAGTAASAVTLVALGRKAYESMLGG